MDPSIVPESLTYRTSMNHINAPYMLTHHPNPYADVNGCGTPNGREANTQNYNSTTPISTATNCTPASSSSSTLSDSDIYHTPSSDNKSNHRRLPCVEDFVEFNLTPPGSKLLYKGLTARFQHTNLDNRKRAFQDRIIITLNYEQQTFLQRWLDHHATRVDEKGNAIDPVRADNEGIDNQAHDASVSLASLASPEAEDVKVTHWRCTFHVFSAIATALEKRSTKENYVLATDICVYTSDYEKQDIYIILPPPYPPEPQQLRALRHAFTQVSGWDTVKAIPTKCTVRPEYTYTKKNRRFVPGRLRDKLPPLPVTEREYHHQVKRRQNRNKSANVDKVTSETESQIERKRKRPTTSRASTTPTQQQPKSAYSSTVNRKLSKDCGDATRGTTGAAHRTAADAERSKKESKHHGNGAPKQQKRRHNENDDTAYSYSGKRDVNYFPESDSDMTANGVVTADTESGTNPYEDGVESEGSQLDDIHAESDGDAGAATDTDDEEDHGGVREGLNSVNESESGSGCDEHVYTHYELRAASFLDAESEEDDRRVNRKYMDVSRSAVYDSDDEATLNLKNEHEGEAEVQPGSEDEKRHSQQLKELRTPPPLEYRFANNRVSMLLTQLQCVNATAEGKEYTYTYRMLGRRDLIPYLTQDHDVLEYYPIITPTKGRYMQHKQYAEQCIAHLQIMSQLGDPIHPRTKRQRYIHCIVVQDEEFDAYSAIVDVRYHILVGVNITGVAIGDTRLFIQALVHRNTINWYFSMDDNIYAMSCRKVHPSLHYLLLPVTFEHDVPPSTLGDAMKSAERTVEQWYEVNGSRNPLGQVGFQIQRPGNLSIRYATRNNRFVNKLVLISSNNTFGKGILYNPQHTNKKEDVEFFNQLKEANISTVKKYKYRYRMIRYYGSGVHTNATSKHSDAESQVNENNDVTNTDMLSGATIAPTNDSSPRRSDGGSDLQDPQLKQDTSLSHHPQLHDSSVTRSNSNCDTTTTLTSDSTPADASTQRCRGLFCREENRYDVRCSNQLCNVCCTRGVPDEDIKLCRLHNNIIYREQRIHEEVERRMGNQARLTADAVISPATTVSPAAFSSVTQSNGGLPSSSSLCADTLLITPDNIVSKVWDYMQAEKHRKERKVLERRVKDEVLSEWAKKQQKIKRDVMSLRERVNGLTDSVLISRQLFIVLKSPDLSESLSSDDLLSIFRQPCRVATHMLFHQAIMDVEGNRRNPAMLALRLLNNSPAAKKHIPLVIGDFSRFTSNNHLLDEFKAATTVKEWHVTMPFVNESPDELRVPHKSHTITSDCISSNCKAKRKITGSSFHIAFVWYTLMLKDAKEYLDAVDYYMADNGFIVIALTDPLRYAFLEYSQQYLPAGWVPLLNVIDPDLLLFGKPAQRHRTTTSNGNPNTMRHNSTINTIDNGSGASNNSVTGTATPISRVKTPIGVAGQFERLNRKLSKRR